MGSTANSKPILIASIIVAAAIGLVSGFAINDFSDSKDAVVNSQDNYCQITYSN